jgi:hypothetical protein
MSEDRKFYRTVISVVVLSEGPFIYDDLDDVNSAITTGDHVGTVTETSVKTLTGKQAANALLDAGSEPGFFELDDEGNDID